MQKEVILPAWLQGSAAPCAGAGCFHPGDGIAPVRGESKEWGLRTSECGSRGSSWDVGCPHCTLCDVKTSKMASPGLASLPWGW